MKPVSHLDLERFNLIAVNAGLQFPRRARMDEQDLPEPELLLGEEVLAKIADWVGGLDEKQLSQIESLLCGGIWSHS